MAHRPRLFLVAVDGRRVGKMRTQRAVWSASSLSAASPPGAELLPCSRSQMACGESPTSLPMSPRVIPLERRSDMRDDQVFIVPPSVRHPVFGVKRHLVTGVRDNTGMAGSDHDPDFRTLGSRLKHWVLVRQKEKLFGSYATIAKASGVSTSHISDIINGHQKSSTKLPSIAAALRINAHWLETGRGDPLDLKSVPQPPAPNSRLMALITDREVADFTEAEIQLLQFKFRESVREIRSLRPRRNADRTG